MNANSYPIQGSGPRSRDARVRCGQAPSIGPRWRTDTLSAPTHLIRGSAMKRTARPLLLAAAAFAVATAAAAHDLFVKMDSYHLPPGTPVQVPIVNGTFQLSEKERGSENNYDIIFEPKRQIYTTTSKLKGETRSNTSRFKFDFGQDVLSSAFYLRSQALKRCTKPEPKIEGTKTWLN